MEKHHVSCIKIPPAPEPSDFVAYLPYACRQLAVECFVIVHRVSKRDEPIPKHAAYKMKLQRSQSYETVSIEESTSQLQVLPPGMLRILAGYDRANYLVEIEMDRNSRKPREVFKIIQLLIQFHPNLSSFVCRGYIDEYTVPEIDKILSISNITDVNLDDTCIKSGNYFILLDETNCLKNLSLARCKINDTVVEKIAERLIWPHRPSKFLSTLNLATNFITDTGAQKLANTLRSNRHLVYLNLSDNQLTDFGAQAILNVCMCFPITNQELVQKRERFQEYSIKREELIEQMLAEETDEPIKIERKRSSKSTKTTVTKNPRDRVEVAESFIAPFVDPFQNDYLFFKNGLFHSYGNHTLCYLNLAYNSLFYPTLMTVLEVMRYQKALDVKQGKGLVKIKLEGNAIPDCKELYEFEDLTRENLLIGWKPSHTHLTTKKKGHHNKEKT